MRTIFALLLMTLVQTASVAQSSPATELAPLGKLRVAMIAANPVLVTKMPDGTVGGVSVALGNFIAGKLGVPMVPVVYPGPAAYGQSFGKGEWDIAIGPVDIAQAQGADVSPVFMLVDYLIAVAPGRDAGDLAQLDRPGTTVAAPQGSAAANTLTKVLKSATLLQVPEGVPTAVDTLRTGKADAYGAPGQVIYAIQQGLPGVKILSRPYGLISMLVALPKGRSPESQARLAQLVRDAKSTGILQQAIETAKLKGVRVAPD